MEHIFTVEISLSLFLPGLPHVETDAGLEKTSWLSYSLVPVSASRVTQNQKSLKHLPVMLTVTCCVLQGCMGFFLQVEISVIRYFMLQDFDLKVSGALCERD